MRVPRSLRPRPVAFTLPILAALGALGTGLSSPAPAAGGDRTRLERDVFEAGGRPGRQRLGGSCAEQERDEEDEQGETEGKRAHDSRDSVGGCRRASAEATIRLDQM